LKQRPRVGKWAVRCSESLPWVKDAAADRKEFIRFPIVEAHVGVLDLHEVFWRKRQLHQRTEVFPPGARERISREFHEAECVGCCTSTCNAADDISDGSA